MISPLPLSSTKPYPPPHQHVFKLKNDKLKELNSFLMSKVIPTNRKKDSLLTNLKEVIGDADTFTVEYLS